MSEASKASSGRIRTTVGLVFWPLLAWGVIAALGWEPTRQRGGAGAMTAMLLGQGVVVLVTVATLLLTATRLAEVQPARRTQLAFKAIAIRMLITLAAIGLIVLRFSVNVTVLLLWAAITYFVLVQVETIVLVRWMRRLEKNA